MWGLGRHLHGPCALRVRVCREICWHWWLHQSWSQCVAPVQGCVAVSLGSQCWAREVLLAGDNCSWACCSTTGTRRVTTFLLLHWTIKPTCHCLHPVFGKDAELRGSEGKFLRLSSEQHFSSPVLVRAESEESDPLGPLGSQPFQPKCQLILTLQWTRARCESNTLPQSQNKQDIPWTGADQTLWKHRSPGTPLMPLKMTCLPNVWLLVLSSADEDGYNQGSSPWWTTGDIKSEAVLHWW